MRHTTLVTCLITLAIAACVPGSPIYFGPPAVSLEGDVVSFEDRQPLPRTEVCVFGTDTLCVAADENGQFKAATKVEMLLEGGVLTVRFRAPGRQVAVARIESVQAGVVTRVDCAVSNRFSVSSGPVACLPVHR